MRSVLFIILVVLISGCGKKMPGIRAHFSTGDELIVEEARPYFNNFVAQAKCLNVPLRYNSLKIVIVENTIKSLGLCTWSSTGHMLIQIDKTIWDDLSYPNREKTVVHEMGHCSLGIHKHTNPDTDIYRIMNPELFTHMDQEFMENYDQRIKEVFNATDDVNCQFAYTDLEESEPLGDSVHFAMKVAKPSKKKIPAVYRFSEEAHDHSEE